MDFERILDAQQTLFKSLNLAWDINLTKTTPNNIKSLKKRKGIYYTPPEITNYICFQSITYDIFNFLQRKKISLKNNLTELTPNELQTLQTYLSDIKILDPACGAGVFLIQSAEILFKIQQFVLKNLDNSIDIPVIKRKILMDNIFGVDFFDEAVSTSKILLMQWLDSDINFKPDDTVVEKLNSHICSGNSLIGWLNEDFGLVKTFNQLEINQKYITSLFPGLSGQSRASLEKNIQNHEPLHWKIVFQSVMEEGGFNIIVGNPPYVFIRGKNFTLFEKKLYKAKYLKSHDSLAKGKARQSRKLNLFSLFIIRSIELLKAGGQLGFIIPNTILRTTTNDFIRQYILENTHIEEIVDLKEGIFKDITASTIMMFLQKIESSTNPTIINHEVQDISNYQYKSHTIFQDRFKNNPVYVYNIHLEPDLAKIFQKMKETTFDLGLITREIIEGIVCRKSDNLFSTDPTLPIAKKLLRGKDIGRYQIHWPNKQYILYAIDTAFTETKLHRPRPQWVHEAPEKFLTQRIGGGLYPLKVAYDNSQYYTFASINNIVFNEPLTYNNQEYLPKYILALLNSKLMNAYYLLNFSNLSSLTVNISKTFLESLPIKIANIQTQQLLVRLVDYLIFQYQNPEEALASIEFFDFYLLDSLIYELYFQNQLNTNLLELLDEYIAEFPTNTSSDLKYQFTLQFLLKIQQNPLILETLTKIKRHPLIQRLELLFQERSNFVGKNK